MDPFKTMTGSNREIARKGKLQPVSEFEESLLIQSVLFILIISSKIESIELRFQ